jgi:mannitol-1-phosphate 5-dehydrogenase
MKKLVQLGAGKIGRSFIGQVFGRSGYEVVFVDIDREIIRALNKTSTYDVIIKGETTERITIKHVRGIYAGDKEIIAGEIADADIMAVSVGKNAIKGIAKTLAEGLVERRNKYGNYPIDIILAENMKEAARFLRYELMKYLPPGYPLENLVGLVETSIGKMVPIMSLKDKEENILQVFAEPYNSLIVDRKAFKNPIPGIKDLAPKENIAAWVDRKLFIHNLGHAAAAYYGYLSNPGAIYIYEVLANKKVHEFVREAMQQSSAILRKIYPGEFTSGQLSNHIDDLLFRFQNRSLGDTVFRVGCDLHRKLAADDRMVYPLKKGYEFGMPVDKIFHALVCGIYFRARDEKGEYYPEDERFIGSYQNNIKKVMIEVCKFDEKRDADIIEASVHVSNRLMG